MFDAIESWLFRRCERRSSPLLLVVEDLHWSTSSTQESSATSFAERAGNRSWSWPPPATPSPTSTPVSTLLGDLERSPAVTRVTVGGLDRDEVAALLAGECG